MTLSDSPQTALPIAVDAVGGDGGLKTVVEAVLLALAEGDGPFILVGPQPEIEAEFKGDLPDGLSILDAPHVYQ